MAMYKSAASENQVAQFFVGQAVTEIGVNESIIMTKITRAQSDNQSIS